MRAARHVIVEPVGFFGRREARLLLLSSTVLFTELLRSHERGRQRDDERQDDEVDVGCSSIDGDPEHELSWGAYLHVQLGVRHQRDDCEKQQREGRQWKARKATPKQDANANPEEA